MLVNFKWIPCFSPPLCSLPSMWTPTFSGWSSIMKHWAAVSTNWGVTREPPQVLGAESFWRGKKCQQPNMIVVIIARILQLTKLKKNQMTFTVTITEAAHGYMFLLLFPRCVSYDWWRPHRPLTSLSSWSWKHNIQWDEPVLTKASMEKMAYQ